MQWKAEMEKVAKSLKEAEARLGIFESPPESVARMSPADLVVGISRASTRLSALSDELARRNKASDKSTSKWFLDICCVCKDSEAVPDNVGMCGHSYCTSCVNKLDVCTVCNKKLQIQKLYSITRK